MVKKKSIYLIFLLVLVVHGCAINELQQDLNQEQTSTIDQASDEALVLDKHNELREYLGLPYLSWSDQVAKDAQNYADTLASNGKFEHDKGSYTNGPYGENLYSVKKSFSYEATLLEAVESWAAEIDFYNYEDNSCSVSPSSPKSIGLIPYSTCGHYTQIIWKDTSYVGCAKARYKTGSFKNGYVVVCKYKKPGNIVSQKPY